jgi:hypothetical protein
LPPVGGAQQQQQQHEPEALRLAKAAALDRLRTLKANPSQEARQKGFKDLLRAWHPDKNPKNVEVATAVFQLIQSERHGVVGK